MSEPGAATAAAEQPLSAAQQQHQQIQQLQPQANTTPADFQAMLAAVPQGPQAVLVEGVTVHVCPDVMFARNAVKPPWHDAAHRNKRKEMIDILCVA
jgi:adenosyl cobinamide kinase/adenosyl cobinamide phosphate guanylyltransferase